MAKVNKRARLNRTNTIKENLKEMYEQQLKTLLDNKKKIQVGQGYYADELRDEVDKLIKQVKGKLTAIKNGHRALKDIG